MRPHVAIVLFQLYPAALTVGFGCAQLFAGTTGVQGYETLAGGMEESERQKAAFAREGVSGRRKRENGARTKKQQAGQFIDSRRPYTESTP